MTNPSFGHLGLSDEMTQALAHINYTEPTPIQYQAIPILMSGKDIIGQAATGTGKTAAFAIPIIEKIIIDKRQIQAVVICPTRELAIQVADEFRKFSQFKKGLTIVSIYGGQPMERQRMALHKKPQILIATPGRMLDFLRRGTFHLNSVQSIVLDEADEMLNMGFRDDIESIFEYIPTPRQTVLFSATMPDPILKLTRQYQNDPERISIVSPTNRHELIQQYFMEVNKLSKHDMLIKLIDEKQLKSSIVFCNTKRQVDYLVDHLHLEGYPVEGLHGGKTQGQRERILGRFRKGFVKVLVATDVAARGIDVRNIEAVVNYDLPEDIENYTHRIGRTGRAGQEGLAYSIVSRNQRRLFQFIQKEQRNNILLHVLEGDAALPQDNYSSDASQRPHRPFGQRGPNNPSRNNNNPRPFNRPRSADNNKPEANSHNADRPVQRDYKKPFGDKPQAARRENTSNETDTYTPPWKKKRVNSTSDKPAFGDKPRKQFDKPFGKKRTENNNSTDTPGGRTNSPENKAKHYGNSSAAFDEPRPFRKKASAGGPKKSGFKPASTIAKPAGKPGNASTASKREKPRVKTTTV